MKEVKIESRYGSDAIRQLLPQFEENKADVSRLHRITAHIGSTKTFGIKYVIRGQERYIIDKHTHNVKEGQYLLVNPGRPMDVEYRSQQTVHGLCISLDEALLQKAFADATTAEETLLARPHDHTPVLPEFHETVFSGDGLTMYLKKLLARDAGPAGDHAETYIEIAQQLVAAQKTTRRQIANIRASKASTRKELFTRLNQARNLIDSDTTRQITIAELARECALSEFHFLRSFKDAFGCTPHQYHTARRLAIARDLLLERRRSVTEIAYLAGFSDIFSFSKTFRKHFMITPSQLLRSKFKV